MDMPIETDIPPHVPPELVVRSFPFAFGGKTTDIPFDRMVTEVHETRPDLFWVPGLDASGDGGWIPRREADMRTVYQDSEHFSSVNTTPFAILTQESWRVLPLESDEPLHGAYRVILNPIFAPRRMAVLEGKIKQYARDYVLAFRDKGRIDFLHEFAFEFPIKVFLELVGLPLSRTKQFLDWVNNLLHAPDIATLVTATNEVVAFLRAEIEERKTNPREDLFTQCVQARGADGATLSDDEVLGFCFNLFVGGLDTVSTNLTWQFLHLARNPEHQRLLRAHPEKIPDAIEEFMRAFASVMTFRICVKETTVNGVTIKPGDKVAVSTTLAARDPAAYENPDAIILDRKPRHISFGFGPHLCVGMHLARREMRMAMEEFLAVIPEFRLASDVEMVTALHGVMQPDTLVLEWDV